MKTLSDIDKLKYWLDTEFCILHIMFAIIMLNLTEGWFWTMFFVVYIIVQVLYMIPRLALIATADKFYLRVPKK